LRGSNNVFIDGRPSNALNMAEALRQIPADAIDKGSNHESISPL
jgi:hypothetical protein